MSQATRSVLGQVEDERLNQREKWGPQKRTPLEWLPVLVEEVGEVSQLLAEQYANDSQGTLVDMGELRRRAYEQELIQVAAVAVAMIETLRFGVA